MNKTINPLTALPPLQALRNTEPQRSCHQLGVCQSPAATCGKHCQQALQPLAPGVVSGPYRKTPARLSRIEHLAHALLGGLCLAALAVATIHLVHLL